MLSGMIKGIDHHLFSEASMMACCTAANAVFEDDSGKFNQSRLPRRNTSVP